MPKNRLLAAQQDKVYGATVIGTKGQVVIPAEARKDLHLKPGDRLVVLGKMNKALGLVKADDMASLLNMFLEDIDAVNLEQLKKHAKREMASMLQTIKKLK